MPWHPLKQARRSSEYELTMVDPWMGPWGVIRRLRFEDEVWYRGVLWAARSEDRVLVGYSQDLRLIAFKTYRAHMHSRGNTGPINGWARTLPGTTKEPPADLEVRQPGAGGAEVG